MGEEFEGQFLAHATMHHVLLLGGGLGGEVLKP